MKLSSVATGCVAATLLASAPGTAWAQASIQYGRITNVQMVTQENARAQTGGALVGGALGNQVGKGDGRKAATVAGAVIGGAVGRDIDRRNNPRRPVTEYQTQCRIEPSWHPVRMYDVTWRDRGRLHTERMDIHPGTHVRVYD